MKKKAGDLDKNTARQETEVKNLGGCVKEFIDSVDALKKSVTDLSVQCARKKSKSRLVRT